MYIDLVIVLRTEIKIIAKVSYAQGHEETWPTTILEILEDNKIDLSHLS